MLRQLLKVAMVALIAVGSFAMPGCSNQAAPLRSDATSHATQTDNATQETGTVARTAEESAAPQTNQVTPYEPDDRVIRPIARAKHQIALPQ